jgi:serine/threonine-protein kinase
MDPARVEDVFLEALDLDPREWDGFLAARCSDPAVAAEVRSLLEHAGDDTPLPGLDEPRPFAGRYPERIGTYRIVRPLGEGGMGVVLLAIREGEGFEQTVALKLLPGRWVDPLLIARFESERELLADLEHPGIARLIDGGVTDDGQPYYAMEYVAGDDLLAHADARGLDVRARVELFIGVCEALHYAHQKLVVHRDLKPSNILVGDGGRPKLLDFGIARRIESEGGDHTRQWVTPAYASPEQILGRSLTTRSDIYSLGVLLCELLAGGRPYATSTTSPAELGRMIEETVPRKPSDVAEAPALARRLRGDLDTIVATALAKDPERRYDSAAALAEDLRRHLDGRPIGARADGALYTFGKFVGRHRALAAMIALLLVTLVAGSAGIAWQAQRAVRARDLARDEADRARLVTAIMTDLFRLGDPTLALGDTIGARQLLDEGTERVESQLADDPVLQATLFLELGRVYRNLGIVGRAEDLALRSVDLRASDDPGSLDYAEAVGLLGGVMRDQARPADAVARLEEALAIRRANGVAPDSLDAAWMSDLGWAARDVGEHARANEIMTEALALQRRIHGSDHPAVANTLLGLASTLHDQGSFDEAEALLLDAIDRGAADRPTPSMASLMLNVGMVRRLREQYADADRFLADALGFHEALLGREHPATLDAREEYATNLAALGRFAEARPVLDTNLEIAVRTLGEDHVRTRGARETLALVDLDLGDARAAEARLDSVLVQKREALGPDHAGVVFSLIVLGEARLARGDLAGSDAALDEALSIGARSGGNDGVYGAWARRDLAEVALAQGEPARADSLLRIAETLEADLLRPNHRYVLDAARTRARIEIATGRADLAVPRLREVLDFESETRPTPHPRKGRTLALLHAAYAALGQADAADAARDAALREFAALPEGHPDRRALLSTPGSRP